MNIDQAAITLAQQLVQIPSESSHQTQSDLVASEKRVNEHLASFCITRGVNFELQEVTPGRNNFIAHFPRKNAPKLLILAHSDTVSAKGMSKGFAGAITDNRLIGRGACDDKGPLAAALATLTGLHREKTQLAYDVTFAATIDEECSMAGSAALAKSPSTWDLIIGLEPTELKLINAHKGIHRCTITTKGLAAHSSEPKHGRNAILAMHAIINDLQVLEFRLKRQQDTVLGRASLAITQIQGGTSANIIPDHCQITVDTRLLPSQDLDLYAKQLQKVVGLQGDLETVFMARGIQTDIDQQYISKLQHAIDSCGHDPKPGVASYATDCSQLTHKGPCIVWGPGSISQAHQLNEYIDLGQIKDACRILHMFFTSK